MNALPLPFVAPVRGVTHYQDNVSKVRENDPVTVVHEADNPYDPHACKVLVDNATVGYLPKDLSVRLRARGGSAWSGKVHQVLVGDYGVGLRIQVTGLREGAQQQPKETGGGPAASNTEPPGVCVNNEAPAVTAHSGRQLGTLDSYNDEVVWVRTKAGQRVSYPAELVRVDR